MQSTRSFVDCEVPYSVCWACSRDCYLSTQIHSLLFFLVMKLCLVLAWDWTFQTPLQLGVALCLNSCQRNERGRDMYHLCSICLADISGPGLQLAPFLMGWKHYLPSDLGDHVWSQQFPESKRGQSYQLIQNTVLDHCVKRDEFYFVCTFALLGLFVTAVQCTATNTRIIFESHVDRSSQSNRAGKGHRGHPANKNNARRGNNFYLVTKQISYRTGIKSSFHYTALPL